ncbi:MAG TPA: hypothetical protein VF572_05410 [Candidatus Saccharimonadales bacterium]|jgi:hypothetical protein
MSRFVEKYGGPLVGIEPEAAYRPFGADILWQEIAPSTGHGEVVRTLDNALTEARKTLGIMQPWQGEILDGYLELAGVQHPVEADVPAEWGKRLAAAPSENLLGFLEWNAKKVINANESPKYKSYKSFLKKDYRRLVEEAVEDGHYTGLAIDSVQGIDDVDIVCGDVLDVEVRGYNAYFRRQSDMVVGGTYTTTHSYRHEFGHKLGQLPYKRFNEAVTENETIGLESGNFDTYGDLDRGSYRRKRGLVDATAVSGVRPIDKTLFGRAYIEQDIHGDDTVRLLDQAIDGYPGVDIWNFIEDNAERLAPQVVEAFPAATVEMVSEASDMYAGLAVRSLGSKLRGSSYNRILQFAVSLDDETTATLAALESAENPNDQMQELLASIEDFTAGRFSHDLKQGIILD